MATLNDEIRAHGDSPVRLLRSGRTGAYPFPVRAEFTNWRDEQESWRTTAALMDLSHHMTDLHVEGPDCYRLLAALGANSFAGFGPMKAKQFITCSPDGHMIGDCILFCLAENVVRIVGRPPALNWVQYNAEAGGYDVTVRRDERTAQNPHGRELYRLQLQGPNAAAVFEKVNAGPLPAIPFFGMGKFTVGGKQVTALNHRMSGFPGLEFFGPYAELEDVRAAVLEAGRDYGLRQIGGRAYASVATESGWIANTVPAVYTGEELKDYRDWLHERTFEANLSLGGSFVSPNVEDYYVTPWDLGYGHILKFDHEFVGRAALERRASDKHRTKVWLAWHREDVAKVFSSMYEPGGGRFKYIEMPAAFYAASQFDRVERGGELVGLSTLCSYTANVRGWISIAMIDTDAVGYGDEVELVWGEPDRMEPSPAVESHTQTTIRATVVARPFPADKS